MGWWSDRQPFGTTVVDDDREDERGGRSSGYDKDGFKMLVEDESGLPRDIEDIDTCAGLWAAARDSGATPVAEAPDPEMLVNLEGQSKDGTTIVAMRAVITKHSPAPDGVLLLCPPEVLVGAGQEPIHLRFDLSQLDVTGTTTVRAERTGGDEGIPAQFENGFSITLKENESVQLDIETTWPSDAIEWHIEADALVNGHRRTIVIDDDGKDFRSPGDRALNEYRRGHSGEEEDWLNGPPIDWGIDPSAARGTGSDGGPVLRSRDVLVPMSDGLDIYIPHDASEYRWIRHDGDKLIEFNPSDVEPDPPTLRVDEYCGRERGSYEGRIREVRPPRSEGQRHGRQNFDRRSVEFVCSIPASGQERDASDPDADEYWNCAGARCPEVAYVLQSVQRRGSDVLVWYRSDELPEADRTLAARLLGTIQEATP
jgi:hypothetical protein